MRGEQANRLVVTPDACCLSRRYWLAIHRDLVISTYQGSGRVQDAAVHCHLAQTNQSLDLATGRNTRSRHGLGDSFHTFGLSRRLFAPLATHPGLWPVLGKIAGTVARPPG